MLEVVDYHGADGRFNEVLVLESLPFFEFQTQDDFVGLQECDRALLDFFEPRQHRINLAWEVHFLLAHLVVAVGHDTVIDDCVGQIEDVFAHSILLLEDA